MKNGLRPQMFKNRLVGLAMISIEKRIPYNSGTDDFAQKCCIHLS